MSAVYRELLNAAQEAIDSERAFWDVHEDEDLSEPSWLGVLESAVAAARREHAENAARPS